MRILNPVGCMVLGAAVLATGCGKQERMEGVQLAKTLESKKASFASANSIETDLVNSARAWCAGIAANGAGRGAELEQNARVAGELAKSAVAASARLSEVRQGIDAQTLHEEYPRSVRNELITQLTQRQRMLQDMRALLEQSAPQFLEYRQSKAYAGDTYPDGIGKLNAMLSAHKGPEDTLGSAVAGLKAKYKLSDSEI